MLNKFIRHIGNFLIAFSLIGFLIIFYPLIQIYLAPPDIKAALPEKGTYLTIPKIHAQAQIIENVNPWDPAEYLQALKKGVAHARGTALPGQKGTIYLFAHSSAMPWDITRYNSIFLRLGELRENDLIIIMRNGERYEYLVQNKKEVRPEEINYLLQTGKDQLILQTCTPIGTSLRRLLIFAKAS